MSEYNQHRKLLLPVFVSEPLYKGEEAQTEGDSEAGDLVWIFFSELCSKLAVRGHCTLLNDSHKPWVTTDRKVNTNSIRSMNKLHPLGQDNGL